MEQRELAKAFKHLREKNHVSQEIVAQALGIPRSAVSLIESGERDLKFLEALAAVKCIFDTATHKKELDNLIWEISNLVEEGKIQLSQESSDFLLRRTWLK